LGRAVSGRERSVQSRTTSAHNSVCLPYKLLEVIPMEAKKHKVHLMPIPDSKPETELRSMRLCGGMERAYSVMRLVTSLTDPAQHSLALLADELEWGHSRDSSP
jgi:hypothetical protein